MKKILLIAMLMLTIPAYTQLSPPLESPINLNLEMKSSGYSTYGNDVRTGPIVMVGGAAFILAGLLTPPVMEGGSTTIKKPFYKQIRSLPILAGGIVMTVGLAITITGN
jgi:cytochrome c biogenesis factor